MHSSASFVYYINWIHGRACLCPYYQKLQYLVIVPITEQDNVTLIHVQTMRLSRTSQNPRAVCASAISRTDNIEGVDHHLRLMGSMTTASTAVPTHHLHRSPKAQTLDPEAAHAARESTMDISTPPSPPTTASLQPNIPLSDPRQHLPQERHVPPPLHIRNYRSRKGLRLPHNPRPSAPRPQRACNFSPHVESVANGHGGNGIQA